MAHRKRREMTTDELLRLQEEPPRKRARPVQDPHSDESEHGPASDSEPNWPSDDTPPDQNHSHKDESPSSEELHVGGTDDGLLEAMPGSSQPRQFLLSRVSTQPRSSLNVSRRPPSIPTPLSSTFEAFGISSALLSALHQMSIRTPTGVQAACIPPLLQGRDCVGNAKTGSGKTIAFAIPILQQLSHDPYGIFALVLTPTRELAFQIAEQFAVLGSSLSLRTAVVVGGMDILAQAIEVGNRPHVVVATPGRLVDLMKTNGSEWNLSRVKFLVLDEADRLLTPTFSPELSYLFDALPKERQTCLFTATWTPSVEVLTTTPPKPGKETPFIYRMAERVETVETLKQHYVLVPSHVRELYLYHLLRNPPESTHHLRRAPPEPISGKKRKGKGKQAPRGSDLAEQPPPTIIFCNKPRTAAYLTALLKTLNIRRTALHSRLSQRERLNSLGLFRASVVPVLVSTDIGGRGLDIEDVAMVVNWDLPIEPEEYTHRVGRTARAGRGGVAVSFVTERDEDKVLRIEARICTKLVEMLLPEGRVLENLNIVSTAKRLASMELHDSNFGRREEIHRIKDVKRKAVDEVVS